MFDIFRYFENLLFAFEQYPLLYYFALFLFGAIVGSFLNVVIYRLPVMMQRDWRRDCLEFLEQAPDAETETFNLNTPRSRCGHCGHRIGALENIPLLSYLVLGGKCSSCKTRISPQYPLVELFTALVSIVVGWHFGVTLQAVAALLLTWSLIALGGIDIGHKLLPDSITLPLMWLGILLALFDVYVDLETSVIGAMAGYLSLWTIFMLFKLITGKEGMGHGDFKLLAALGAWLGWKPLFIVILVSSAVGAVVGITLILLKRSERGTQIPFGPYLAAAGWITLLWGDGLMQFYLSLFGPY